MLIYDFFDGVRVDVNVVVLDQVLQTVVVVEDALLVVESNKIRLLNLIKLDY